MNRRAEYERETGSCLPPKNARIADGLMITTIIFDLSEVYLTGFLGAERHLEKLLGIKAGKIRPGLIGADLDALFNGKLTEDEYWARVIGKNNWNVSASALKRAVRRNFVEIEGTRKIIEQIGEKRIPPGPAVRACERVGGLLPTEIQLP